MLSSVQDWKKVNREINVFSTGLVKKEAVEIEGMIRLI